MEDTQILSTFGEPSRPPAAVVAAPPLVFDACHVGVMLRAVLFVQVVLGVAALQGRDTAPYKFHMFYGFIAAFTVAIVYSYRAQLKAHQYLLYGFGGLFLMGLGLRALQVGPH